MPDNGPLQTNRRGFLTMAAALGGSALATSGMATAVDGGNQAATPAAAEGLLEPAWRVETTAEGSMTNPVISDGVAYHTERNADGGLAAYGLDDGSELWRIPSGINDEHETFVAKPALVDGTLYVGSTHYTYAVDAESGAVLWRHDVGGVDQPTVANGRVFVRTGPYPDHGRPPKSPQPRPTKLVALDDEDGSVVWQTRLVGEDSMGVPKSNGVVTDAGLLLTYDGSESDSRAGLQIFDEATGGTVWLDYVDDNLLAPVVADGTAYLASDDGPTVIAHEIASASERWRRDIPGKFNRVMTLQGDGLYVLDSYEKLYRLDPETGDLDWAADSVNNGPDEVGELATVPRLANGYLVAGDREENLLVLDAATGEIESTYALGDTLMGVLTGPPTVSDEYVLTTVENIPYNDYRDKQPLVALQWTESNEGGGDDGDDGDDEPAKPSDVTLMAGQTTVKTADEVTFTVEATGDVSLSPGVDVEWELDGGMTDGGRPCGTSVAVAFVEEGTYTVEATVVDRGESYTATQAVEVEPDC
ncbi:PQQ-binding-like beta-propeller repeat protein [Haloarchaeobius sp. DFWS5]|uniref:outer membrane protein assembly factor BamB family protein n=1 Tax=Haloarchaeobius sp. DFWS5 TaxID=3446114 RepID=UPI003EBE2B2E